MSMISFPLSLDFASTSALMSGCFLLLITIPYVSL